MRGKLTEVQRMSYVLEYRADGHDDGCAAHCFEPCNCASGIVRAVSLAFSKDLKRILGSPAGRAALQQQEGSR